MKFVQLNSFGTPSASCSVVDGPALAEPGPGEVTVNIEAGPINPAELLLIQGKYASKPPLPAPLGIEGVGTVAAIGDGVTSVAVGDRVMSLGRANWAEQVQGPEAAFVKVPGDVDVLQLGMLKVNPATAALMLDRYVDLQPGDWVIQNAGNSAVGQYLVQIARARGLHTVNIVRRAGLEDELRALGADLVMVDGADLAERVRAEIGTANLPLAIDAVAGRGCLHVADCLSDEGTVVNYGLLSGEPCQISADMAVFRGISLTGFWLAKLLGGMPRQEVETLYAGLASRIADGSMHAAVEACYGLDDIGAALDHAMQDGRHGKILVTPDGMVG